MRQYVIRRTLLNFAVLFLVATMVFGALRIDPDNVVNQRASSCFSSVGDEQRIEECKAAVRHELGLDRSIFHQYVSFISGVVQLDFGKSFFTKEPVILEIKDRAGPSIQLGLMQIGVALLVALPVGIMSAIRQDTWIDYVLRFLAIALLGIPVFIMAVFVIVAVVRFGGGTPLVEWLSPNVVWVNFFDNPIENLKRVTGPALVGGLGTGAIIMRFLRSQMLEVLRQDYVRTAWAKGLRERVIVLRHALKNALIPVLTLIGILLGSIVSGNVILETLYNIPGLGFFVVSSIRQFDYPVVQGIVLTVALTLVFVNLLVDIAYGWLDPRIRYG
jgi:peptide/nickel transport system permease protein